MDGYMSVVEISNSTFTGNQAATGGVLQLRDSDISIKSTAFESNKVCAAIAGGTAMVPIERQVAAGSNFPLMMQP
jgi:hypothetical protein